MLQLEPYRKMKIGTIEAGLPVVINMLHIKGVRKVVMLGLELCLNPSIIFLDEPTTGLDSQSALFLVQILERYTKEILNRVSKTGRSIICTIHQPSSEIFAYFTHVMILRKV